MSDEKKNQDQEKSRGSIASKLVMLLVLAIIGFAGFLMIKHSQQTGKKPWEWSGDEWSSFVQFAGSESKQIGGRAIEKTKAWIGKIDGLQEKAEQGAGAPGGDNVKPEAATIYRQGAKELSDACVLWQDAQGMNAGIEKQKKYAQARDLFESAIAKLEQAREIDENVDPEIDAMIDAADHYRDACEDKLGD